MKTLHRHRLQIEQYALLTESAAELGTKLDEWYDFYLPATPGECELLDLAVMSSVQRRRVLGHLTEVVNQGIRTADFDFDCAQEDEVEGYRAMLETAPGAAILGLKRSALGVRLLIARWDRLQRLLRRDGTWYGRDRDEAINCQGALATPPENLSRSEGAYLTFLYCLMAQPAPKDKDFVAVGNERWTPPSLYDRDPLDWLGVKPVCRQILEELVERELASLRQREERLRINYEVPARDGAEVRRQVLTSPEGAMLLRHERAHGLTYHRAYEAFLKGRLRSLKTGRPPGAPGPVADEGSAQKTAAVDPGRASEATAVVAEGRAGRKREAEALAPGPVNGIGAAEARGEVMVATVLEARAKTWEEAEGSTSAEVEEADGTPTEPSIEAGDSRGLFPPGD